jgi:hypothetical protein
MAERPVFIPQEDGNFLVQQISVPFFWHKGMEPIQKKKNVAELHAAAAARGLAPLLEVSTKSEEKLGQRLSAFNLKVALADGTTIPLECAYQGSKVFDGGGPYPDLFDVDPQEAKRDPRLKNSGALIGFRFESREFPLFPKTAFYEWLYLNAIYPHREFLRRLHAYAGFTDIEFNPAKSLNCQARACATFVALDKKGILDSSLESPRSFIATLRRYCYRQPNSIADSQHGLFSHEA